MFLLLSVCPRLIRAAESAAENIDSVSYRRELPELSVVGARETVPMQRMAASGTTIDLTAPANRSGITRLKDVSAVVPNLFIPDYGSRLTTATFIRGVGNRMGGSSIALYVDNIPYMDPGTFDFNFYELSRMTLLRGPQGTLYGRNSLAGVVGLQTTSPFAYRGLKTYLSMGSYGQRELKAAYYARLANTLAVSVSGYGSRFNGFYTNRFNGQKADREGAEGGRVRLQWLQSQWWRTDLIASYDHVGQNGYPYKQIVNGVVAQVDYNDPCSYRRDSWMTGLVHEYQRDNFVFNSTTSYQHFHDRLLLDQDFTADSVFNMAQRQRSNAITQEFIFKSKDRSSYQWVAGVFGFARGLDTDSPMTFGPGGVAMIQQAITDAIDASPVPAPAVTITNHDIPIPGTFKNPTKGVALYHQSSYQLGRLGITAGVRVSYETASLRYDSRGRLMADVAVSTPRGLIHVSSDSTYVVEGRVARSYWDFLPKAALRYDIDQRNNIYASLSKGNKSAGFNIQMFSDILQAQMQSRGASSQTADPVDSRICYKPEVTWNYELGAHTQPVAQCLFVDAAVFYIDYHDQQMAVYTGNGSRMVRNAGRTRSVGFELSARALVTDDLTLTASYGYTDARFVRYNDGKNDHKGKTVPFAPRNTLSVAASCDLPLTPSRMFDKVTVDLRATGAGPIYWTEDNRVRQSFYMLLGGGVTASKGNAFFGVWGRNILNTAYQAFYFNSLGNDFVQMGRPAQFGVEAGIDF